MENFDISANVSIFQATNEGQPDDYPESDLENEDFAANARKMDFTDEETDRLLRSSDSNEENEDQQDIFSSTQSLLESIRLSSQPDEAAKGKKKKKKKKN